MTKQEIRSEISYKKSLLTRKEIDERSLILADKFCALDEYKNTKCIFAYVSYNQEVNTKYIIEKAWADGKRVAVPKTLASGNTLNKNGKVIPDYMEFIYIDSFDELEDGYVGIKEPCFDEKKVAQEKDVLILMPGLAFDKEGNRIGYGGGFYDKYLSSHYDMKFTKVALCFEFQFFDSIPIDPHDEKMDFVLTQGKSEDIIPQSFENKEE